VGKYQVSGPYSLQQIICVNTLSTLVWRLYITSNGSYTLAILPCVVFRSAISRTANITSVQTRKMNLRLCCHWNTNICWQVEQTAEQRTQWCSLLTSCCTRRAKYIVGKYCNCLCCLQLIITETAQYFIGSDTQWSLFTNSVGHGAEQRSNVHLYFRQRFLLSAGIDAPTSTSFETVEVGMRTSRDRLANHDSEALDSEAVLEYNKHMNCVRNCAVFFSRPNSVPVTTTGFV
jgi:hypothetical protein